MWFRTDRNFCSNIVFNKTETFENLSVIPVEKAPAAKWELSAACGAGQVWHNMSEGLRRCKEERVKLDLSSPSSHILILLWGFSHGGCEQSLLLASVSARLLCVCRLISVRHFLCLSLLLVSCSLFPLHFLHFALPEFFLGFFARLCGHSVWVLSPLHFWLPLTIPRAIFFLSHNSVTSILFFPEPPT